MDVLIPKGFDYKSPQYVEVFAERARRLERIRKGELNLDMLRAHYKTNIADFINDWGMTSDPRNVEVDLPATVPFLLWIKQREWIEWTIAKWRARKPGITEKSRDMGLSWLMTSTACALCLFYPGMAVGFGSRKQEYVDRLGDPKCLFYKAREFMRYLPREFKPGWSVKHCAPHMRLMFPNGSTITGEAGDNIGRGDRTGIYFTDEDAYIEHPEMVDAALSNTTNCRIRVSSVHGMANTFAIKRHEGKIDVFTFHWRDDPRKGEEWYAKKREEEDPIIVAQEIDIDYTASVIGALIPSGWVQAAIDADIKLQWPKPTGRRLCVLDPADEGKDFNAFISGVGSRVDFTAEWSGIGLDLYKSVQLAFQYTDDLESDYLRYDADGLGAGVRGDGNRQNELRAERNQRRIALDGFKGSMAPMHPLREDVKGRKNQDFFANLKAQCWWRTRQRFEKTWRAVEKGMKYPPEELIAIPSALPHRAKLCVELSQPTFAYSAHGKVMVDKTPDGAKSPNLADCLMMWCSGGSQVTFNITDELLQTSRVAGHMQAALTGRQL